MFVTAEKDHAGTHTDRSGSPRRRISLRLKSLIVYGALIVGAAGVLAFVLHQRGHILGQFDRLQEAYAAETRLHEVDMTILTTVQVQVLGMKSLGIEYDSPHVYEHLGLLLSFFNQVISRHIEQGPEVISLRTALQQANEAATPENMAVLDEALRDLRRMIEERLQESRGQRETLATTFRSRADAVGLVAMALLLLAFTALGIINGLFFTRLTRDVRGLTQQALEIAGGQRRDRIPVSRGDEVGELIDAINRMADDLEARDRALDVERQRAFHREKMVAIGVLAAGIAHEIGNPIAAITGLMEELREACNNKQCDDVCADRLGMALTQIDRLKKITREISAFAHPQPNTCELVDLNSLIKGTCSLMRYDRRWRRIDVQFSLDNDLPAVEVVPDQVMQVVMNVLVNAADALEGVQGRKPTIRIATNIDVKRNAVELTVCDNGHGMDEETRRHAMDAFFTTKDVGKGTGLGLSLCHSIITAHKGGEIQVESEPEQGTAVRIFLPLGGMGYADVGTGAGDAAFVPVL